MNLLTHSWVPVVMPSAEVKLISLVELPTSGALRVSHARADFAGLITELLCCLFQSAGAPKTAAQKASWLAKPQEADLSWLTEQAKHFELFGSGNRFMQPRHPLGNPNFVSSLTFEAPGANTIKNNKDLFIARDAVTCACPTCATAGLFLNTAHAREGGSGYRVSARGGSAMTTLVEGPTLWHTVMLNVLPQDKYESQFCLPGDVEGYPWTKGIEPFTSPLVDVNIVGRHASLWWMPVALYLHDAINQSGQACSYCGAIADTIVTHLSRAPTKSGPPLQAHPYCTWRFMEKTGQTLPNMAPATGDLLGDWHTLQFGNEDASGDGRYGALPAALDIPRNWAHKVNFWSFGAVMNKTSMVFWFDERNPLFLFEDKESRAAAKALSSCLVKEAQYVANKVWDVIKPPSGAVNPKARVALNRSPYEIRLDISELAKKQIVQALRELRETPDGEVYATAESILAAENNLRHQALRMVEKCIVLNGTDVRAAKASLEALQRLRGLLKQKSATPDSK